MLTGSIGMLPSASLDAARQGPVRADPRQRARHRRQGRRQSAGYNSVRRHDASLLPRPARGRRPHRAGGAGTCSPRGCARPTSGPRARTQVGTRADGRRRRRRAQHQNRRSPRASSLRFVAPCPPARRPGGTKESHHFNTGHEQWNSQVWSAGAAWSAPCCWSACRPRATSTLIEPLFFSTSDTGGTAPALAKNETRLQDAYDIEALKRCSIIITCQGGDYTKDVYPQLRAAGWNGYWIDAASTLRMQDDAVIVLDPVNLRRDQGRARARRAATTSAATAP